MSRPLLILLLGLIPGGFGPALLVCAHEGPEHEIDELTEQMNVQGQSADLLLQRAIEYRVLGKYGEAAKDLERALTLPDASLGVQRELSQNYFSLGKTNEALTVITHALADSDEPAEKSALYMVRVGILRARRDYAKALRDSNEAIRLYPENVEWYLVRSQLQKLQKQKAERVQGLDQGMRETGSGLLVGEWVDALIDNGQTTEASKTIEAELPQNRWRAAWLIRRAKVRQATGQGDAAEKDLLAAIDELNQRLATGAPDALLLADRGLAYDLRGKKDEARRDYRAARDKGFGDEWVRERIRALRNRDDADDKDL